MDPARSPATVRQPAVSAPAQARANGAGRSGAAVGSSDRAETDPAQPANTGASNRYIGVVTRSTSWFVDAVLINIVAVFVGIGVSLFLSIFPISKDLSSVLKPVGAVVYAIWTAAYFIAFWSTTGQTPGARVMQIRLVTARQERLKPRRALLRWIGMTLAMIPLFAGYLPILFGRRGFPDWLAHTLVLDAPQLSLAEVRRQAKQAERETGYDRGVAASRPARRSRQP